MSGVFETLRVRGGRLPFLAAHLVRLAAAAPCAGLAVAPGLRGRLLAYAAGGDAVVRVTVDAAGEAITTRPVPAAVRLFNLQLSTVSHQPYPFKSTDRALFDRARAAAVDSGAHEALLLTSGGFLAEGAITSVAFWRDGALCLPSLDLGILPGIGRDRLLAVAREQGGAVEQGRYPRAAWDGRPLVLVNAVRGIVEVATLDGVVLPRDPRTSRLATLFWPRG